jgi:hypothetical protein
MANKHVWTVCLFLTASGACVSPLFAQTWQNPDNGSAAGRTEISDCRSQARRDAERQYPVRSFQGTLPDDSLRFQAETSLFDQCMHRKGFVPIKEK